MKNIWKGAAGLLAGLAAAEVGGSLYLYNRTMKRHEGATEKDKERTMKMSGTDWDQYMPLIQKRKEYMMQQPHEDVYLVSEDGLRLHATYFPRGDEKKLAICFHGYTSHGMSDYIGLSDFYFDTGFSMLLPDARAHGESEGEYIGFGCLDRKDALLWINWAVEQCGEDVQILLHGTSMGGATVLMATGLELPKQVKGVVADCGFTSPKEVFSNVLQNWYHMPPFPMLKIADEINKKQAGYGLDECNAAREVKKAKIPALLIHGSDDTFVPCAMCHEIYNNYAGKKRKLIIIGAAHAESYYKDMDQYEGALEDFMEDVII
ncbi:MAG: alpha/beta hydrolase [Lachnospiraceae bacterium]|nr:alpha/beta hydrolase [Lachnospiraceae bacterium]